MRLRKGLFIAALLAGSVRADPVGMFTDVKDVGAVSRGTEASYESATGTYTLGASGENIWARRDAFGLRGNPMNGDAAFAARVELQGTSAQEHRKAGLMFRQSLEPDSAYVDVVVHGNGLTSLQFRTETGGPTREVQCARQAPNAVRLEKRGDYVLLELSDVNGKFEPSVARSSSCFAEFSTRVSPCRARQQGVRSGAVQSCVAGALPKRRICALPPSRSFRSARWTAGGVSVQVSAGFADFTGAGNAVCFREDGRLMYFSLTANTDPHLVGARCR